MKKWLSKQLVNWLLSDINRRIDEQVIENMQPLTIRIAELQNDMRLLQIKLNVLNAMLSSHEPDAKQAENPNQA
jgi:hypothetical protein